MSLTLPDSSRACELEPRQLEVLTMIGHGYTDAAIAEQLHMSKSNVRYTLVKIRVQLGLVPPAGMHPRALLWLLACRWQAVSEVAMPAPVAIRLARRVV